MYYALDIVVADPGDYGGSDFEYFVYFKGSGYACYTYVAAFSGSGFKFGISTTTAAAQATRAIVAEGSRRRGNFRCLMRTAWA